MGFVRRRARRRTALLVGGAAYAAGRAGRGGSEQYQQEEPEPQQQEVPPAPPAPAATGEGADIDELEKLADLHTSGALNDEEFSAAKAKILQTSPSGAEEQS